MNKKKQVCIKNHIELEKSELEFLQQYDVPVVSKAEIDFMANMVSVYLPKFRIQNSKMEFWKIVLFELMGKSSLYWVCCAVALTLSSVLLQSAMDYFSPILVITLLSPIPLLAYVIETLLSRDPNVVELEMTCWYDIRQLYIGKLLVGILLNVCFTLVLVIIASSQLIDILRYALCALSTMFLVGIIVLFLVSATKNALSTSFFLALWVIGGAMVLRQPEIAQGFEETSAIILCIIFLVSIFLFIIKLMHSVNHIRFYIEIGGNNH